MSTDSFLAELPAKDQAEINDSFKVDITQETVTRKTSTRWLFDEDCIAKDVNIAIKPLSLYVKKCRKCHAILNHSQFQDLSKEESNSKKLTVSPIPIHNTIFRTSLLNAVEEKLKTLNKRKGRSVLRIDFTVECINPDSLKPSDMVSVNVDYVSLTSMQDLTYDEYCELFGYDEHVERIRHLFRTKDGNYSDMISKDVDSENLQYLTYEEYCRLFGCSNHIKRLRNLFPKEKCSLKECLSTRKDESDDVSQKNCDHLNNNTISKSNEPEKTAEDPAVVYYHPPDKPMFALLVQQVKEKMDAPFTKEALDDPASICAKCWIEDKMRWIRRLQLLCFPVLFLMCLSIYFLCYLYFTQHDALCECALSNASCVCKNGTGTHLMIEGNPTLRNDTLLSAINQTILL